MPVERTVVRNSWTMLWSVLCMTEDLAYKDAPFTEVLCDALPVPDHGRQLNSLPQYKYPQEVGFTCADGYTLRGSNVRQCRADSNGLSFWSGFQPECIGKRRQ
jgi:hypothetical protein